MAVLMQAAMLQPGRLHLQIGPRRFDQVHIKARGLEHHSDRFVALPKLLRGLHRKAPQIQNQVQLVRDHLLYDARRWCVIGDHDNEKILIRRFPEKFLKNSLGGVPDDSMAGGPQSTNPATASCFNESSILAFS